MTSRIVGPVALVVGCAITTAGLLVYQDWWTIAFAVGGVSTAVLARAGWPNRALVAGVELGGSILLAIVGLFLLYIGSFGPARPCDGCSNPGPMWMAAGLAALGAGLALGVLALRHIRRAPRDIR